MSHDEPTGLQLDKIKKHRKRKEIPHRQRDGQTPKVHSFSSLHFFPPHILIFSFSLGSSRLKAEPLAGTGRGGLWIVKRNRHRRETEERHRKWVQQMKKIKRIPTPLVSKPLRNVQVRRTNNLRTTFSGGRWLHLGQCWHRPSYTKNHHSQISHLLAMAPSTTVYIQ